MSFKSLYTPQHKYTATIFYAAVIFLLFFFTSCGKEDTSPLRQDYTSSLLPELSIISISPSDSATTSDTVSVKWTAHQADYEISQFMVSAENVPVLQVNYNNSNPFVSDKEYEHEFQLTKKGYNTLDFTITDIDGNRDIYSTDYYIRYENEMAWQAPFISLNTKGDKMLTYKADEPFIFLTPKNTVQTIEVNIEEKDYPIKNTFLDGKEISIDNNSYEISVDGTKDEYIFQIKSTDTRGKQTALSFFIKPLTIDTAKDTAIISSPTEIIEMPEFSLTTQMEEKAGSSINKYIEVTKGEVILLNSNSDTDGQSNDNYMIRSSNNKTLDFFGSQPSELSTTSELTEDNIIEVYQENNIPTGYIRLIEKTDTTVKLEINHFYIQ